MRHLIARAEGEGLLKARSAVLVFLIALALLSLNPPSLAAQSATSAFAEGERLFREDRAADALPFLEKAVQEASVDERAWLYLSACYEKLGRYDEMLTVLRKGNTQSLRYRYLFFYDMGNAFVLQGKNSFAEDMYTESIAANANYAPAYLNRANARVTLKNYEGATFDYGAYLGLEAQSPQRPAIEAILRLLGSELQSQREAQAALDAQRQAEEAAKKALYDQVAASLKASAEETTSLSAGSGQVQGYGDDLELDQ